MNAQSVEELSSNFGSTIENVRIVVELKNDDEGECKPYLQDLQNEMENLEGLMALLRTEISKQRDKLKESQALKENMRGLIEHLEYTTANIPERLPKPAWKQNSKTREHKTVEVKEESVKERSQKQKVELGNPNSTEMKSEKHVQSAQGRYTSVYTPAIEYITVDDFETVPKYMRGRLTYTQVNSAVDEINKAFVGKYKILRMKKSTLNDINRKRYQKYKQQESKDTTGEYFVTDEDIKEFSTLKLDRVYRSYMTILRHCRRMKEIRGGKLTRYACVEVY